MKTTAADFKRLLPTLAHFARFPKCKRSVIAATDGADLAAVEATIADLTDGAPSLWDEEALAAACEKFGAKPPAARGLMAPAKSAAQRAGDAEGALITLKCTPAEARRRVDFATASLPASASTEEIVKFALKHPAPRVAAAPEKFAAKSSPAKAAKPTAAAPAGNRLEVARARFVRVGRDLLADETLSEFQACKQNGCSPSGWDYFKKTRLDGNPLDRKKLRIWLDVHEVVKPAPAGSPRAAEPIAPKKRKYTRRRLPQTTAAPAGAAAPQREELRVATAAPGAAVAAAGPATALGRSLIAELLTAQLTGGRVTQALGEFRLELDLRLVPIAAPV